MDQEVKQRNRRRKRAQRMQAQRENITKQRDGDSADEEIIREKPQRPPIRRKKSKEPLVEEDIIDGFAIFGFKSYDDLELVLKISSKENIKHLVEIDRPKLEPKERITHHISVHNNHGLTLTHDPATSDDSGRASERLTGSSVPPRDADSSRDRLSDASSRCSSGKGYICDSEGEDDKGSDASSVIFGSAPASRKHEFPGALPPSLPLSNGLNGSPVPAPTPPNLPAPSPAPAQLPPIHPPAAISSATVPVAPTPVTTAVLHKSSQDSLPCITPSSVTSMPPVSIQMTMPQTAAAPLAVHPPALDPSSGPGQGMRTDSPAVGTSANAAVAPGNGQQYHQPPTYQPLYAPYSVHQPYATTASATAASVPTTASVPAPSSSAVTTMATCRDTASSAIVRASTPGRTTAPSPGGRERESYSSSIRSLSRSSNSAASQPSQQLPPPLQQQSCQPPTTVSSSLVHSKPWSSTVTIPTVAQSQSSANSSSASAAPPRPTPPLHSGFPPPMFAAPLPPVSTASPHAAPVQPSAQPSQSNPFAAENLFQSNQTDMLRRELDNRFLASQDRTLGVAPPPYLRTEMHQHQHHHTHVHQHTTSLLPPPTGSSLFPSPLTMSPMDRLARRPGSSFKDIPKLGSVDSPFYRQNLAIPNYPGYTPPGLIHPGLTAGPTPFVPPTHLPTFQPKSLSADPTKPKVMKTGKWNAMHVRVAWEIYHHQQKSGEAKGSGVKTDLLRPPTHLFSPSVHSTRPHELAFPPSLTSHRPPGFDQPHPSSLFAAPSHLGKTPFAANALSPFSRYSAGFPNGPSPFAMPHFANPRDVGLGSLHDPWRNLQRTVAGFPPSVNPLPPSLPGLPPAPWTIKPDPILEQREREAREREERERERQRREREERERREREEKQRRLEQQQQEQRERERREKERREMERRELERERERERILHQQRLAAESAKQVLPSSVMRDRSPMRNGQSEHSMDIRVKEEPRIKEEDILSRTASDPRFAPHSYLRHHPLQPPPPPSVLDRSRMMATHGLHYPAPPASHWPPQHDPFYRYDPLRYNPIMDVIRAEEERVKMFGAYSPHHPSQIRTKDPSLMHLRPGPGPPPSHHLQHKMSVTPPTDLHKKEEPR